MSEFARQLRAALAGLVTLSNAQLSMLEAHYNLLERWNARMNLTAIRTLEEAVVRHYAESVYFAELLTRFLTDAGARGRSIADVGSGAGFPGIPIAVVHANFTVSLIESNRRKAVFLSEASHLFRNVEVINARAETVSREFDVAVSRAVDPQSVLRTQLAPRFGLLLGEADVPRGTPQSASVTVRLPWGSNRVAWFGDRRP